MHATAVGFRAVRVVRAYITETITATGTLQPVVTSPVGSRVSEIVWKLHADDNSTVKPGDLLVALDPALFKNAVALATVQLAQAEAGLTTSGSRAESSTAATQVKGISLLEATPPARPPPWSRLGTVDDDPVGDAKHSALAFRIGSDGRGAAVYRVE
jgi:multidrug efflux pump subunit AcrA (membrane-fusion protein)